MSRDLKLTLWFWFAPFLMAFFFALHYTNKVYVKLCPDGQGVKKHLEKFGDNPTIYGWLVGDKQ